MRQATINYFRSLILWPLSAIDELTGHRWYELCMLSIYAPCVHDVYDVPCPACIAAIEEEENGEVN